MAIKVKIERYKNPANVSGWAGYIEPEDRAWILYWSEDGRTKFYPDRDPATGAVIEPDAPMRRFVIWRHLDTTGVSGCGLVAYGWERVDGRATVRWLGRYRTETVHELGMESVLGIHGHAGRTAILMCDVDPEQIVLPAAALPAPSCAKRIYLTRSDLGWIVGLDKPMLRWVEDDSDAICLRHGDRLEGLCISGDAPRPSSMINGHNAHMIKGDRWSDVVELLACDVVSVAVARTGQTNKADLAHRWISA